MKNKVFKSIYITVYVFIIAFVAVSFSGCLYLLSDSAFVTEVEEDNLKIRYAIDSVNYDYSEKVLVHISANENSDILELKSINRPFELLKGSFDKISYNKGELFIVMDNTYYVLDVENYQMPATTVPEGHNPDVIPEHDLREYTYEDFKKAYPDSDTYEWDSEWFEEH